MKVPKLDNNVLSPYFFLLKPRHCTCFFLFDKVSDRITNRFFNSVKQSQSILVGSISNGKSKHILILIFKLIRELEVNKYHH